MTLQKRKSQVYIRLKKQLQEYKLYVEKREEELTNILEENFTPEQKKSALELVQEATSGKHSITRAVICFAQILENKRLLELMKDEDAL
jgi:predicted metal-binding transcription factor (methanogenesis marker protein 9)